jgi:hypothetical protein
MLRDNPPPQSQSESDSDSLHHAGDVGFKTVFQNEEAALEYLKEFCPEFVDHLDLGVFHLDTTSYVNQQFDEFFSDVVYRTQLKETFIPAISSKKAAKKKKHPVAIVLLFEHKKHIRSYFLLFLQLLEYIIFIWRQDLANKKKPSLVIPIVVFQGKNGLKIRQFRDCFKGLPEELYKYFPNFEFHLTNVHPLSSERILNLNQKGLLRSLFLAYTFIEDRDRIKDVIFEIFSFFKYLPERLDFFKQMLVFISKEGYLSADELTELLEKYLSPEQKEGVVMTTYQEWRQKGLAEGEMNRARKIVLRGIGNGLSIVVLVDTSDLSYPIVEDLMKGYDSVYEFWQTETNNRDVVPQNDYLTEQEVRYLLDWLDKKRQ